MRTLVAALMLGGSVVACGIDQPAEDLPSKNPESAVVQTADDGRPTFVVGELAKIGPITDLAQAEPLLATALPPLLAPFHLNADDLVARRMATDEAGDHHIRYQMTHEGLPVVGGDLIVHVDRKGAINGINGPARGEFPATTAIADLSPLARDKRFADLETSSTRTVFLQTADGATYKALEATVVGERADGPVRDLVYIDVDTNMIVADYPQIETAELRKVYSANHATLLPGTLTRSEGAAAGGDVDINLAYDGMGDWYNAMHAFFNRDSYDNAGASLVASVHYSTNYCNAYWDSTQMVYGDGNAALSCAALDRGIDITAHELTHAVTQTESTLNYSGESGAINESISDIFGAFVEAFVDGGQNGTLPVSTNTWLVGEAVLPPAIRYMCNPGHDGASADVWSSTVGSLDPHYSSGVGNLAFCLLTQGGVHPTGKTTIPVTGIGMEKAIRIFYKANVDFLTSNATYASLRTATQTAATDLGYDQATIASVNCAWEAVKVGPTSGLCAGTTLPTEDTVLANAVTLANQAGALSAQTFYKIVVPAGQSTLTFKISGGTGDADLYTGPVGVKPTTTSYTCRPYISGNSETCTLANPVEGTYYAMLNGYSAYSGVSITATFAGPGTGGAGDPYLTPGVSVTAISGATGSTQYWRVAPGAGHQLKVTISGGTGDADLYTRTGARPTTATYSCRPYITGNSETCTISSTVAGDYYVMLRGYAAFTGVTLKATY